MQGVLRNPLADPYIIGTSAGAAAGACTGILMGLPYSSPSFYLLTFLGGAAATFASYLLARRGNRTSDASLILAGVSISSLLSALITLFFIIKRKEAMSALFFMMGSIAEGTTPLLLFASAMLLAGLAAALLLARQLDLMSLGEEKALSLGISTEKLKLAALSASALMSGAAVCVAGVIGFIGLIVPHITRMIIGPSHRRLIVVSAFCGAGVCALADAAARTAFRPMEAPVGIITALFGAPFFLWLLRRRMP